MVNGQRIGSIKVSWTWWNWKVMKLLSDAHTCPFAQVHCRCSCWQHQTPLSSALSICPGLERACLREVGCPKNSEQELTVISASSQDLNPEILPLSFSFRLPSSSRTIHSSWSKERISWKWKPSHQENRATWPCSEGGNKWGTEKGMEKQWGQEVSWWQSWTSIGDELELHYHTS